MVKKVVTWWNRQEKHSYTSENGEETVTVITNGEFVLGCLGGIIGLVVFGLMIWVAK